MAQVASPYSPQDKYRRRTSSLKRSPGLKQVEVYHQATAQHVLDRYRVCELLGVGGFSKVKRGIDKLTGREVAVKIVERARYTHGDASLEREIQVLCRVNHPHCIQLDAVYLTPSHVYLITELVKGGELLDRIHAKGSYSEKDAADLIRQVLGGVAYLHSIGIVHRDLKLENMLLADASDNAPIKIADFGLSKFLAPDSVLSTMCGSPQYVAPEILGMGDGVAEEYSPAVDMWSVGVILFILLSGYSPFDDEVDAVLFEKIKAGEYDADDDVWDTISEDAKDLVARLLVVDASQRLTAEEALAHPWLQGQSGRGGKELRGAVSHMAQLVERRASARESFRKCAANNATGDLEPIEDNSGLPPTDSSDLGGRSSDDTASLGFRLSSGSSWELQDEMQDLRLAPHPRLAV